MQSLDTLAAAAAVVTEPEHLAEHVLHDLSGVAPRLLFNLTFFEGERALRLSLSRSRVGATAVTFENHAHLYARSAVRWNRWAVEPKDRQVQRIPGTPREMLGRLWSKHGIHDHRRIVATRGDVAIALIGASVFDDHAPAEHEWREIERRMQLAAGLISLSRARLPVAAAIDPCEAEQSIAYLSPDGTVLARAACAARSPALRRASRRLADGEWDACSFEADGNSFVLTPSAELRDHGGFTLQQSLAPRVVAERQFFEALRRGLTNREIALVTRTTPTAVKRRLERLYQHYEVTNRVELLHVLDGQEALRSA